MCKKNYLCGKNKGNNVKLKHKNHRCATRHFDPSILDTEMSFSCQLMNMEFNKIHTVQI